MEKNPRRILEESLKKYRKNVKKHKKITGFCRKLASDLEGGGIFIYLPTLSLNYRGIVRWVSCDKVLLQYLFLTNLI